MNWMSILGLCFILGGTILTFFGTYYSDQKSQEELTSKIQEKNEVIEGINTSNTKLIIQNAELINGKDQLLTQNDELKNKIDNYQQQLEDREAKIKELEKKVGKAKYGVKDMYNYSGAMSPAGASNLQLGTPNSEVFKKLTELEKINDKQSYEEILKICNLGIEKTPDWFTLYLFKGKALHILGRIPEAIKEFEFVINTAPDNSEFIEKADAYIKLLKETRK